jgi:serine/threonine-protein kinase RsbW
MPRKPPVWSIDRWIPSQWEAGQQVVDEISSRLVEHEWTESERFGVALALTEAVVNAIRHGNRQDSAKRVRIVCRLLARRLWIKVIDQGAGFNPQGVPDPTSPERLEVPSGRGLMLMRSFMTRVAYNAQGNAVVMELHRHNGK